MKKQCYISGILVHGGNSRNFILPQLLVGIVLELGLYVNLWVHLVAWQAILGCVYISRLYIWTLLATSRHLHCMDKLVLSGVLKNEVKHFYILHIVLVDFSHSNTLSLNFFLLCHAYNQYALIRGPLPTKELAASHI